MVAPPGGHHRGFELSKGAAAALGACGPPARLSSPLIHRRGEKMTVSQQFRFAAERAHGTPPADVRSDLCIETSGKSARL